MKFIVSSSFLLKQLSAINGVITTNPVVPILENFLFEISDGTLTITASDLQTSMITELEVEAKEDGSIAKSNRVGSGTEKSAKEIKRVGKIIEDYFKANPSVDDEIKDSSQRNGTRIMFVPDSEIFSNFK